MNILIKSILTLAVLLILQGCGFHLRGGLQGESVPLTYLKGGGDQRGGQTGLRGELSRVNGITDNAASAEMALTIISENFTRHVLSVGTTGKVREYELRYVARFAVSDKTGTELLAPQTISLTRDYRFDTTQVLGSNAEEDTLRQDMARDAAQQILRRLQALKSN